jgi:hypothetical protein
MHCAGIDAFLSVARCHSSHFGNCQPHHSGLWYRSYQPAAAAAAAVTVPLMPLKGIHK